MLPLKPADGPRLVAPDFPLLRAIISGGQTGADFAGIRAGQRLGLATGGWAPKGWVTLQGPMPRLGTEFGLTESNWGYAGRTKGNVRSSDGTVRFALDFFTPGERCTWNAAEQFHKPLHSIHISSLDDRAVKSLRTFLVDFKISILNVAGNSENHAPGIGTLVEDFLVRVIGLT